MNDLNDFWKAFVVRGSV